MQQTADSWWIIQTLFTAFILTALSESVGGHGVRGHTRGQRSEVIAALLFEVTLTYQRGTSNSRESESQTTKIRHKTTAERRAERLKADRRRPQRHKKSAERRSKDEEEIQDVQKAVR